MDKFYNSLDDRAESFLQVGTVAKKIAEDHVGLSVDDVTHERWSQLMGLLREVDTLADDGDISSEQVLARLNDFSEFSERYPALTRNQLGNDVTEVLINRTDRVLRIGKSIAQTTSIQRFTALRIVEGREVATYLADTATEAVREQPGFNEEFLPTMQSMAVTANLLDSLTDGRADFKHGKVMRRADAEFYKTLLGQVPRHAKLGRRALMHTSVMQEFGLMSWNRLVNRVRHRDSVTTSLNNFK